MNQHKSLIKNISSLSFIQGVNLILPLVSVPIISRILEPDKFGVVNYAATFVGYFNLLIDYGFNLTATRRVARDPFNKKFRNQIFSEVLSSKIILFIVSIVLFIFCLFLIDPLANEKIVSIFSFFICISTVLSQNWMFQAMQNLSKIAILNFVGRFSFTIIILLIVRQKKDYIWYSLTASIIPICISIISYIWATNKYKLHFKFVNLSRIKEILYDEKLIFFSTVVISLYTTTNVVVLGIIQPENQVGLYIAAQKLIMIAMTVINMPLTQALYPFIGKAFGESRENGINTVHRILPIVSYMLVIVITGMFLLGPIMISVLYGETFSESLIIYEILCILPLFIGFSNMFGVQLMLNMNMDKLFFFVTSLGAIIGLVCNIIFTHYWSSIGTAINWVMIELFMAISMYFTLRRKGVNPINMSLYSFSEVKKTLLKIKSK